MRRGEILSLSGALVLTGAIVYSFLKGDFLAEGAVITEMLWGRVTLIDIYIGFFIMIAWMLFRERSVVAKVLWTLSFLVTGNVAICLYLFLAFRQSRGDWARFFGGSRTLS